MIKGCNVLGGGGSKIGKHSQLCGVGGGRGRIFVQQEKISRVERRWTNPMNTLQEAILYSFIKFFFYCFPLWYEFFVHYGLKVEKKLSTWS